MSLNEEEFPAQEMQQATYMKKAYFQFGHFERTAVLWYNAYCFTDRLKVTSTEVFLSLLIFILRGENNNYPFEVLKCLCFKGGRYFDSKSSLLNHKWIF